jgi:hypothetical protein
VDGTVNSPGIIGISGWAQSGKDTFAQVLIEEAGFTRMSFAEPMRQALLLLNPLVTVAGIPLSLVDVVADRGWEGAKRDTPETRGLLQRFGTEVGREMFGTDFWVNYLLDGLEHSKVVITDVRYLNEASAIVRRGGQMLRVERPGVRPANAHPSENSLDDYPNFAVTVPNDRGVAELRAAARMFIAIGNLDA